MQIRTLTISSASFTFSSCEQLFGKVHQGHVNWGGVKDVLSEVNNYQRDPCFPFSHRSLRPISQPLFIQVLEKKEGTLKGLYTPHSWKLIGLFTTQGVLRVRKCSRWSKSFRNLLPFPALGLVLRMTLSSLQFKLTYVV